MSADDDQNLPRLHNPSTSSLASFAPRTQQLLKVCSSGQALCSRDAFEVELCGAGKHLLMAVITALNRHLPS